MITESHVIPAKPGAKVHLCTKKAEIATDFIEAFNNKEYEKMVSVLDEQFYYTEIATKVMLNECKTFMQYCELWHKFISDLKGQVTNALTMDDTVVLEISWTGTQDGTMDTPGIKVDHPCNKVLTIQGVYVIEFNGYKIKAVRNYFDLFQVMKEVEE